MSLDSDDGHGAGGDVRDVVEVAAGWVEPWVVSVPDPVGNGGRGRGRGWEGREGARQTHSNGRYPGSPY